MQQQVVEYSEKPAESQNHYPQDGGGRCFAELTYAETQILKQAVQWTSLPRAECITGSALAVRERQSIHLDLQKDGNFVANLLLNQQLLFLPFSWITRNRKLSEIG